jgi:hypothetical protein
MPAIYFCEDLDDTDEFALGREEIMEINSALDVFNSQDPVPSTSRGTDEKLRPSPVNTTPSAKYRSTHSVASPTVNTVSRSTISSPNTTKSSAKRAKFIDSPPSTSTCSTLTGSVYAPPSSSSSSDEEENLVPAAEILKYNMIFMRNNPRIYFGIPENYLYVLDEIAKRIKIPLWYVYMIIRKIRVDEPYQILANNLGSTAQQCRKIFRQHLSAITELLFQFVYWPDADDIESHMPYQFKYRFHRVQSIIDCFEVQIQKPSKVRQQAASWSSYKHANTIKYLISTTPSGHINFISGGYGGRITDQQIVDKSSYIEELPRGSCVLADRGFKNIEGQLHTKQCKLIRPPSTRADEELTKEEVLSTKRIASVRIHVERVIRRLREFKMCGDHAKTNNKQVDLLDCIIKCASGIANLQPLIIK